MYCIGIAGGTGSGKTTLARALASHLGDEALFIAHDWYYHDLAQLPLETRACVNFDHPDAIDTPLLLHHLAQLRAGASVEAPQYDFSRHMRRTDRLTIHPRPMVIVEGVLALSDPDLLAQYDLRVFVRADADVRLARRIRRDLAERGRTVEDVLRQWETQVRPMHEAFVEPACACADVVIRGDARLDAAIEEVIRHLRRA